MLRKLRTFLTLPPTRRRLLLRAVALVARARWDVHRDPQGSLRNALDDAPAFPPDPVVRVEDVSWAITTASDIHPGHVSCLPQALAGARLLRDLGHDPTVHVGARRDGDGLHAHAWVEVMGEPVVGHTSELDELHRLERGDGA